MDYQPASNNIFGTLQDKNMPDNPENHPNK